MLKTSWNDHPRNRVDYFFTDEYRSCQSPLPQQSALDMGSGSHGTARAEKFAVQRGAGRFSKVGG